MYSIILWSICLMKKTMVDWFASGAATYLIASVLIRLTEESWLLSVVTEIIAAAVVAIVAVWVTGRMLINNGLEAISVNRFGGPEEWTSKILWIFILLNIFPLICNGLKVLTEGRFEVSDSPPYAAFHIPELASFQGAVEWLIGLLSGYWLDGCLTHGDDVVVLFL